MAEPVKKPASPPAKPAAMQAPSNKMMSTGKRTPAMPYKTK